MAPDAAQIGAFPRGVEGSFNPFSDNRRFRGRPFLRRLGIKARIYSGFGALVALAALLAVIGVWQLFSIDQRVGRLAQVADSTQRNGDIIGDVGTPRRVSQVYKSTVSRAEVEQFLARICAA